MGWRPTNRRLQVKAEIAGLWRFSILGVLRSINLSNTNAEDALRGAGYGAIQGAIEIGNDPIQGVLEAIEASKVFGNESGLVEHDAVRFVIEGAINATENLDIGKKEELMQPLKSLLLQLNVASESSPKTEC